MAEDSNTQAHRLINTTFPVFLDVTPELTKSKEEFVGCIQALVSTAKPTTAPSDATELPGWPTRDERKEAASEIEVEADDEGVAKPSSAFMDGLLSDKVVVPSFDDADDKMMTENADVAYRTSREPLVDLFYELEDVISSERLRDVLDKAWAADRESTLKIIWNARSIHLGKSSRHTFYRAVGWLYENHPATLIANLPWLVRPIIPKKAPKDQRTEADDAVRVEAKDADSDFEMIDEHLSSQPVAKKRKLDVEDDAESSEFDVKYGVAHGYWKDLLNILALAVNEELKVDGNPRKILNIEKPSEKPYKRDWTRGRKHAVIEERYQCAINKLKNDPVYKALHLSVARLFADQLRLDTARLESGCKKDVKVITLAAKWAPSHKGMHDQHTFIVSSIAEALHSFETVCPEVDPGDRKTYLLHAREAYQLKTLPKLRKHLQIVERPITEEKFEDIKYDRVPSLAMKQYATLFIKKDFDRFDKYIDDVARGKSKISGATLLPSTLVHDVAGPHYVNKVKGTSVLVEKKMKEIRMKSIGGQWNTLVQRIKDSGTLESSIAVCDVSGSMGGPTFKDGTCPMDSAIGLSLLLAEITKPPFGGAMITFSAHPQVLRVGGPDDKRSFEEKVRYIQGSNWSMNTDFVAVFEKLILPMAIQHNLKQEDMVKQVFVFSDMQFDAAEYDRYSPGAGGPWSSSYERIQAKFKEAGYEMPKLIFWNLAGGRAGYSSNEEVMGGNDVAPKPVTAAEEGTALVSGYSQGQLKMFLENGQFDVPEEEDVLDAKDDEDGNVVVENSKKKQDPLAAVKKAISHKAYQMLKVVD